MPFRVVMSSLVLVALVLAAPAFASTAPGPAVPRKMESRLVWLRPAHPPLSAAGAPTSFAQVDSGGDQYTFALTRQLNRTNVHPVWKLTILPVAIVLDLVFLPLALLADVAT